MTGTTPRIGGYFEDETGWWMLEELDDEGGIFVGRDGQEHFLAHDRIPELRYL